MGRLKISQREARRLRGRVQELETVLEQQRRAWRKDWPGGTNFATSTGGDVLMAKLRTARLLGHAIVAIPNDDNSDIRYYAVNPDNP